MLNTQLRRGIVSTALALAAVPCAAGIAAADPPGLPFVPGPPGVPYPGGYSYEIGTGNFTLAPHTTDTRGVRTGGPTGDPTQTSTSMPNSKPGAGVANQTFWMNYSNARYGIQGGIAPPDSATAISQSDTGTLPGMIANGGQPVVPALESPTGTPPKDGAPAREATNSTPPTYPQLEPSSGSAAPATPAPAGQ